MDQSQSKFQFFNHDCGKGTNVPPEIWRKFKSGRQRFLEIMMNAEEVKDRLERAPAEALILHSEIENMYKEKEGLDHVLAKVEFIKEKRFANWTVTTWSHVLSRSQIEVSGTDGDRQRLPTRTRYNNKHNNKRKMKEATTSK